MTGIIWWQGRSLAYEFGVKGWHAQWVGYPEPVEMTEDLKAAIEADVTHQAQKTSPAGMNTAGQSHTVGGEPTGER